MKASIGLVVVGCLLVPAQQAQADSQPVSTHSSSPQVLLNEPTSDLAALSPSQLSVLLGVDQNQIVADLGINSGLLNVPLTTVGSLLGQDPTDLVGQLPLDRVSTLDLGVLATTFGISPDDLAVQLNIRPDQLDDLDPSTLDPNQLRDLLAQLGIDVDALLQLLGNTTQTVRDVVSTVPVPGGTVFESVTNDQVRVVYVPTGAAASNVNASKKVLAISTRSLRRVSAGKRFTLKVKSSLSGTVRVTSRKIRKVSKKVKAGTTNVRVRAPKRAGMYVLKVRVNSSDGQSQTKSVVLRVKKRAK